MRWTVTAAVLLAIAAAAVSASVAQGPPYNLLLWMPAVMTALPLLVPADLLVCLIAAVWLLMFAALAAFTVGAFYLPAALVMLIASVRAGVVTPVSARGRMELTGAARLSVRISFGLTVATSLAWFLYILHARFFRWPAYPFISAPVIAASLPLWWARREATGTAAVLLAGCAFFPLTIEIGGWYAPAVIPMIYAARRINGTTAERTG